MNREQVLHTLREHKERFRLLYGVDRIGIFGSFARDEATDASDVDVVVVLQIPDPYRMVHLKEELEQALGRPVDLLRYRQSMNQFLKERIDQEGLYV